MSKLTKRYVESIQPDSSKTLKLWDTELKGFGVVVLPSGRRTYCVEYRNNDRIKKRLKIGVHGHITTEEARNLAKIKLGKVAHGEDLVERNRSIRNAPTINELTKDYLERHAQKKRARSLLEDERMISSYILPTFGSKKVETLTRREIETLHLNLSKYPYQANRILSLLSKMFSLAISWGWRIDNPIKGIQKYQEVKRDRWLDEEELARLWAVLDQHPTRITAHIFKFLLLTGARKGEAMLASWDQIDLEKGMWIKPSHLTKQKKTEYLPLSGAAVTVLQDVQALTNQRTGYIFSGKIAGQPIKEIKTFWKRALRDANIANARIHDLRHTHASHLVSSGLSLSIVGKLLGHTQASTTQRYAHLADAPLRQAAELFSEKVGRKRGGN